ncbi:MAG: NUDIX domain-containing protein [Bacilli bacterium]|nr:NUDIX domain-containing protein [Bacilli bacterium]MDD4795892.1 NUDIX domain-containing protein [Bacilli bacterium]
MSKVEEMLDIYNDNFEYIGIAGRKEIHEKGIWHAVVACQAFNPDTNKIIFQKKGDVHSPYSKLDITVGGHYQEGEKPEDCIREIKEELNVDIDYNDLIPIGIRQCAATVPQINQIINEFHRVFLLPISQELEEYDLNGEEVSGLVEIDIDDTISILLKKVDTIQGKILYVEDGKQITKQIDIKLDDFIECWRIKDEFLLGLTVACKRYINGEDKELIRW